MALTSGTHEIERLCSEVQKTLGEEIGMEMQARAAQPRSRLASEEITANSLYYLSNCHFVQFRFYEDLEVISRTAMETILNKMEVCKAEFNWLRKGKDYCEEFYKQKCMAQQGADNVENL